MTASVTERRPTTGQWATLDRAARLQNGLASEDRGRGATRRLPALRRLGWIDDGNYLTDSGRAVAAAWEYDADRGALRPSQQEIQAAHRDHQVLTQVAPGTWAGPIEHDRSCPCYRRANTRPTTRSGGLPLCPCCHQRPMALRGWGGRCEECLGRATAPPAPDPAEVEAAARKIEALPEWQG